jgi:hypothetical protein
VGVGVPAYAYGACGYPGYPYYYGCAPAYGYPY